ncbi:metallophosphoesterase, partial [Streptomyces sp. NPDC054841]
MVAVLALLGGVHWYVWRRLVRDTTASGGAARRAGTVAVTVLPLLSVGALTSGRAGAPFWLQQTLAWPGYLWLATLLYLTLALLVGEVARPLLRRALSRRTDARSARGGAAGSPGAVTAGAAGNTGAVSVPRGAAAAVDGGGDADPDASRGAVG